MTGTGRVGAAVLSPARHCKALEQQRSTRQQRLYARRFWMSPRAAVPRPHGGAARGLHRPTALGLLALCFCGSFLLVWRSLDARAPVALETSLSGHSYHPKLCSRWSSSLADGNSSTVRGCGELHDPQLAQERVRFPPDLQLLSGDPQLSALQQLLQGTAQQQWPLPLARRVTSLVLQSAVPPVNSSSEDEAGSGPQLPLSAAESGHAAGWRFAAAALAALRQRADDQLVPCSLDPSLPTDFHTRFLFVASWPETSASGSSGTSTAHANSVLQLLSTVALLPPGYAYISISVPAAAAPDSLVWLDLLQLLAAPLGVPVQLVQGSQAPAAASATAANAGATFAAPAQPASLQPAGSDTASQALNAALAAFFPSWASAAPAAASEAEPTPGAAAAASPEAPPQQEQQGQLDAWHRLRARLQLGSDSATASNNGGSVRHGSCPPGAPAPGCFEPEFVVLLEPQLFFCAGDLVRIMEYPEDLACGIQLDEYKPVQLKNHRHHRRLHSHNRTLAATQLPRRLQQQQQGAAMAGAAAAGGVVEGPMASVVVAAGAAVLKPEVPPEFEMHSLRAAYDAAREITGEMLSAHAPYLSHGPSQALAQEGSPVPMYCCWGGVAKLKAAPLAAGLRFRGGEEGECHPPDHMSLMCDDLWRIGHSRIIMVGRSHFIFAGWQASNRMLCALHGLCCRVAVNLMSLSPSSYK